MKEPFYLGVSVVVWVLGVLVVAPADAFSPIGPLPMPQWKINVGAVLQVPRQSLEAGSTTSSSFLKAVPIFDGSSVVDPVIVSNAFWDGLTRQFVSLLIGQILAATVFGLVTTFAGQQISKMGSFVSENLMSEVSKQKRQLKNPPPGYTGEL
jgi:hypothetical protein